MNFADSAFDFKFIIKLLNKQGRKDLLVSQVRTTLERECCPKAILSFGSLRQQRVNLQLHLRKPL